METTNELDCFRKRSRIIKDFYMPLHPDLLAILACPQCKEKVIEDKKRKVLLCPVCKLQYEIQGGIPVMLLENAKPIDEVK